MSSFWSPTDCFNSSQYPDLTDSHNNERNLRVAASHRLSKFYTCGYNEKKTL